MDPGDGVPGALGPQRGSIYSRGCSWNITERCVSVGCRNQAVDTSTRSSNSEHEASINEIDHRRNNAPLAGSQVKASHDALSYKSRVALGSEPKQEIGRSLHIGLRSLACSPQSFRRSSRCPLAALQPLASPASTPAIAVRFSGTPAWLPSTVH
ncbi:hypothetical protein VTN96DRAFT_7212 [Rasamsonia emersonii]